MAEYLTFDAAFMIGSSSPTAPLHRYLTLLIYLTNVWSKRKFPDLEKGAFEASMPMYWQHFFGFIPGIAVISSRLSVHSRI